MFSKEDGTGKCCQVCTDKVRWCQTRSGMVSLGHLGLGKVREVQAWSDKVKRGQGRSGLAEKISEKIKHSQTS